MKFTKEVTVEITPGECGRKMATLDSVGQAEFFDGLAQGFAGFDSVGTQEAQLGWISQHISDETREFIAKLYQYTHD